jgi:predicted esterase
VTTEHSIVVSVHGRYLVEPPRQAGPAPMLIGFHGYAEPAEAQLERMRAIPGSEQWLIVAPQGLHRFYLRRSQQVVASWMTRQNRDELMDDNRRFVQAVVEAVRQEGHPASPIVAAGFSQGVAMAFRAACTAGFPAAGVIACGGDIPPEIDRQSLRAARRVLIARGVRDEWYTAAKLTNDESRLTSAGVSVQALTLDAGHEWTPEFSAAAGEFLELVRRGS